MIRKTIAEIAAMAGNEKPKAKHGNPESRLQQNCIKWFRIQYPQYSEVLIAVPNGGRRDKVTGAILKAEGVIAGAADLLFLKTNSYYGYLAIEMKNGKHGRQSDSQKRFEHAVNCSGGKYVVCRDIDEFIYQINCYLKDA